MPRRWWSKAMGMSDGGEEEVDIRVEGCARARRGGSIRGGGKLGEALEVDGGQSLG